MSSVELPLCPSPPFETGGRVGQLVPPAHLPTPQLPRRNLLKQI